MKSWVLRFLSFVLRQFFPYQRESDTVIANRFWGKRQLIDVLQGSDRKSKDTVVEFRDTRDVVCVIVAVFGDWARIAVDYQFTADPTGIFNLYEVPREILLQVLEGDSHRRAYVGCKLAAECREGELIDRGIRLERARELVRGN